MYSFIDIFILKIYSHWTSRVACDKRADVHERDEHRVGVPEPWCLRDVDWQLCQLSSRCHVLCTEAIKCAYVYCTLDAISDKQYSMKALLCIVRKSESFYWILLVVHRLLHSWELLVSANYWLVALIARACWNMWHDKPLEMYEYKTGGTRCLFSCWIANWIKILSPYWLRCYQC